MIDFHTHILPGVDDGSKSVLTSISMLREEYRQGIEAAILTPHFYAGENSIEQFLEKRDQAWQGLEACLGDESPRVYLGAEVQFFEGICSVEEVHKLCIEGTNTLLLEMPFGHWSQRVVEEVLELNAGGSTQVVLAHIERYLEMQPAETWQYLRTNGVWMQTNISFVTNWKTRHKAMKMLSRGEIQFLGSDCHNMTTRCPKWDQVPAKALAMIQEGEIYGNFRAALYERA